MSKFFNTLLLTLTYIPGLFMLGLFIPEAYNAIITNNWPKANATITTCYIEKPTCPYDIEYEREPFVVKVEYTFTVHGTPYSGDTIAKGYGGSTSLDDQEKLYNTLHSARTIKASYNPQDPAENLLSPGLTKNHIAFIICGILFVWLAICITIYYIIGLGDRKAVLKNLITTHQ